MDVAPPPLSKDEKEGRASKGEGDGQERRRHEYMADIRKQKRIEEDPRSTPAQIDEARVQKGSDFIDAQEAEKKAKQDYKDAALSVGGAALMRDGEAKDADKAAAEAKDGEPKEEALETAAQFHLRAAEDWETLSIVLALIGENGLGQEIGEAVTRSRDHFKAAADGFKSAAKINVDDGEPGEAAELYEEASRSYGSAGMRDESEAMDKEAKGLKK
jgi:hypothetical protein